MTPLGNGKNTGLREAHGEMDKYLTISIDVIFFYDCSMKTTELKDEMCRESSPKNEHVDHTFTF